jgi:hypothetical protein
MLAAVFVAGEFVEILITNHQHYRRLCDARLDASASHMS